MTASSCKKFSIKVLTYIERFLLTIMSLESNIVGNTPAKPMLSDSSFRMLKLSGFSFFYAFKKVNSNTVLSTPLVVRSAI